MINHKIISSLVWDEDVKLINDEYGNIPFSEKPKFTFSFDFLKYNWSEQCKIINVDGIKESTQLTDSEQNEVKVFIESMREAYGIRKHCVDKDGRYIGLEVADNVKYFEVDFPPASIEENVIWNSEAKNWKKVYYIDKNGNLTDMQNSVSYTTEVPPRTVIPFYFKEDKWILDDRSDEWNKILKHRLLLDTINMIISATVTKLTKDGNPDDFLISTCNILCEYSEKQGANPTIIQKSKDVLQAMQSEQLMQIVDAVTALNAEVEKDQVEEMLNNLSVNAVDLIADNIIKDMT